MPDGSLPLGRRDRAILELFYASGLRLSELVGLDLGDVNLNGRMVRVLGKGGKERIVPFNHSTEQALRAWLRDREAFVAAEPRQTPHPATDLTGRQATDNTGRRATDHTDHTAGKAAALSQLSGRAPLDAQRRSVSEEIRGGVQHAVRDQPARAAAFVCDAPARARRRLARDPGAARPRAPQHHPALYTPQRRSVTVETYQESPPEGVNAAARRLGWRLLRTAVVALASANRESRTTTPWIPPSGVVRA